MTFSGSEIRLSYMGSDGSLTREASSCAERICREVR
jgi:hypothetical protein